MGVAMSTLLLLTTLGMVAIVGIIAYRRPRACLVQFVTPADGQVTGAGPWLLSVNWNGDEGDKKSGGK